MWKRLIFRLPFSAIGFQNDLKHVTSCQMLPTEMLPGTPDHVGVQESCDPARKVLVQTLTRHYIVASIKGIV